MSLLVPAIGWKAGGPAYQLAYQTQISNPDGGSTSNHASVPIGAAAANRHIIIGLRCYHGPHFSSGTVGGQSLALVSDGSTTASQSNSNSWLEFLIAAVTSGTTAAVNINLTGNSWATSLAVWAVYGLPSMTATDVKQTTSTSITLDTTAGGLVIAQRANVNTSGSTFTGIDERFDANTDSGRMHAGGDFVDTPAGTYEVTGTGGTSEQILQGVSW